MQSRTRAAIRDLLSPELLLGEIRIEDADKVVAEDH